MEAGAMNSIVTALVICLLSQSIAGADELVAGLNARQGETTTLSHAITVEAARLAKSSTLEARAQSSQASHHTDTRPWCFRHGAACGALIGYGAGFVVGVVHPGSRDMTRFGYALLFGAPIGAGIGAVVGCCQQKKEQRQP
jgi:hypothetical protein